MHAMWFAGDCVRPSVVAFKFCNGLLECGLWFTSDCVYVTGFGKRCLSHTSNLPTLMTHNYRLENTIELKFG